LVLVAASAMDVLADHAIGSETQIAWQAQLLKVEEALVRGDLVAAERLWRDAYRAALKSRHWQGMVAAAATYRALGARVLPGSVHRQGPRDLPHSPVSRAERGIRRGRAAHGRALRRARRPRRRRAVHPRRAAGRGQLARSADGGVRPGLHGVLGG
jgi:hypothetical protein